MRISRVQKSLQVFETHSRVWFDCLTMFCRCAVSISLAKDLGMDLSVPNSKRLSAMAGLWHPNDPVEMDMG
jgi:hypothetical protein